MASKTLPECFVIMPFSDSEGYEPGHFNHVFANLFRPACERAGYAAVRADYIRETNLIHLDLLQRLLESPMVLCDLSSRNPNVLFELGLRQAFDKPVVLVQETGTPRIFDIAPLRYTDYSKTMKYHEVIEDQGKIAAAIKATEEAFNKGVGVNSIVRILSVTRPAALFEVQEANNPVLQIIRAELSELRTELRRIIDVQKPIEEDIALTDLARARRFLRELEQSLTAMKSGGAFDSTFQTRLAYFRGYLNAFVKNRERFGSQRHVDLIDELERDLSQLEQRSISLGNVNLVEPAISSEDM